MHPAFASNLFAEATIGDPLWSLGHLAVAGAAVALVRLAWLSRSSVVGAIYVVVGSLFALLPWIQANFVPAKYAFVPQAGVLPPPLVSAVQGIAGATFGPLNGFIMLGGVMAIAGVCVIGRPDSVPTVLTQPDSAFSPPDNETPKIGKPRGAVFAVGAAAVSLAAMGWVDHALNDVYQGAMRNNETFGIETWGSGLWVTARLMAAGLAVALATLAWQTRSAAVGIIYVVVGTFYVFLPVIVWNLASGWSRGPGDVSSTPWLSGPLATVARAIWSATWGWIDAPQLIGGVMAVAGAAVVGRLIYLRIAAVGTGEPPALTSQPILP